MRNRPSAWPWLAIGAVALLASGCVTRPPAPRPTESAAYAGWGCDRLLDEIDRVQQRAADVAYAVDARAGHNMIALGLGVNLFWPAVLAMRSDGFDALELAELKARYDAMQRVSQWERCAAADHRAASAGLPVALGDRLVYENRSGHAGAAHELGMRVAGLQRDQLEFALDLDGRILPQAWRQDMAGNPQLPPRTDLFGWQRLLRRDLELGQVLTGELATGHPSPGPVRVRGQVVATGPQRIDGRAFDVAVIELFGDAPGEGAGGSTRLEGMMSVDRRSGVLLRLELRCANASYALRRRLLRVEAAAGG